MTTTLLALSLAIAAPTPTEVQQAIADLKSPRFNVQWAAMGQLHEWGPDARSAWPAVLDYCDVATTHQVGMGCRFLTRIADTTDEPFCHEVVAGLGRLVSRPTVGFGGRRAACHALTSYGQHARRAVPYLRAALHAEENAKDSLLPIDIHEALGRSGADAVPVLLAELARADSPWRAHAAAALGNCGPAAHPARTVLRRLLTDEKNHVRCWAAIALLQMDRDGEPTALQTLGPLLRDKQTRARWAVEQLGPTAAPLVPDIRRLLADRDSRDYAVDTLGRIGPASREAVPELRELLRTAQEWTRFRIARALWRIARDPAGRAALLAMLDRHGSDPRVLDAVSELGRDAPEVWRALHRVRERVADRLPPALAEALWRTAPIEEIGDLRFDGRREAVADLEVQLHSEEAAMRLGRLSDVGPRTVAHLWRFANSPHEPVPVRAEAAFAVAKLDSRRTDEALTLFCKLAEYRWIGRQVRSLGPAARSTLPFLRRRLTGTPEEHLDIANAIWRIDPTEARRLHLCEPFPWLGDEEL